MNLAIITPYYNPCGYQNLRRNYAEYVQQFVDWGIRDSKLFTIELVLDKDPLVMADMTYYGRRPWHNLWQKESMINAAIQQLPSQYDAVAWIDADIIYPNADWIDATEKLLAKDKKLVQLFEYADILGPDRKPLFHRRGVAACKLTSTNAQGAWGMAWAARRDCLTRDALPWFFVAGGGDVHAAKIFIGEKPGKFGHATSLTREFHVWANKQTIRSLRDVAYLPQRIKHLFHGYRENRRYMARDTFLQNGSFDPNKDVVRNAENAFATCSWSDTESALARRIRTWFEDRKEDQETLQRSTSP